MELLNEERIATQLKTHQGEEAGIVTISKISNPNLKFQIIRGR
jgi:hypothetical protein